MADNDGYIPFFVRSANNYSFDKVSRETGLDFRDEVSLTQQEFAEEADINTIVRRFGLTGELPENVRVPMSGDFVDVMDYQSALNAVIAAEGSFMALPAELRARFDNDPQKLMVFVGDDANADEAERLGLLSADAVQRRNDERGRVAREAAARAAAAAPGAPLGA